jgi:predicted naringenin-chalcone synthase
MNQTVYLGQFKKVRPKFEKSQEDAIEWLASAHVAAEKFGGNREGGREWNVETVKKLIARFGCSPDRIASRGHELGDFSHTQWDEMRIFRLNEKAGGLEMASRQAAFDELVRNKCDELFAPSEPLEQDLIHVTCTGYLSPSPLQRFVAENGHAAKTRVLHAYHMGCYASLPASRMAAGLALQSGGFGSSHTKGGVDVVHTELCTLHFNPQDHSPEQLVVQSLFADGFIRYKVAAEPVGLGGCFKILAMDEIQVPQSAEAMTWMPVSWGMSMTLAREVPQLIASSLRGFVSQLFSRAGLTEAEALPGLVYAVHPGGPKIIDHVQALLEIPEDKVGASREVLRQFGNMSSATLPHVWQSVIDRPMEYPNGTRVLSLAFGPGLTIAGSLFEVVR